MTRPIIGFLTEFSTAVAVPDLSVGHPAGGFDEFAVDAEADPVATARLDGYAQGRSEAEAAGTEQLRILSDQHASALAAARAEWSQSEAVALASGLRDGLAALEATLANSLASVLAPLLDTAARVKATAELRQALADLLGGGQGTLITVTGPADILEALTAAFGPDRGIVFAPADAPEVTLDAGDTTIRSQIGAWTARLHAILETTA